MLELRPPSGPGLPLPSVDESWKRTSFFDDPALRRILDSPYHQDVIDQAVGPRALGTIGGGPTLSQAYDILHPNPQKWSTIEPPKALSSPILGDLTAKPAAADASKLGNFNLNLIRPFDSLQDALTTGIGAPPAQDQFSPQGLPFGKITVGTTTFDTPMDILNWQGDLPIKLMEKPLSLLQTAANRVLGTPLALDTGGSAVYPFQKDPAYWAWLSSATDEQLAQFARAQAGQYISPGRNTALFNALLDRFTQDKSSLSGLSSGSTEIDYHAKRAAWNAANGLSFSGSVDVGNPGGQFLGGLAGSLPFVGINLQSWIDPIQPEIEAHWQGLSVGDRQRFLEQQGYLLVGKNLVGMPFSFGGVGALAGAAKASTIPTIAALGKAWSATLTTANVLMATGLTISLASWAAEAWAPEPIAAFGRDVNMGAPLSHSEFGAILNQVGFFASGSFGAKLALRGAGRVAGFVADKGGVSGAIWGTRELPFYTEGFGGSGHTDALHEAVPTLNPQVADLSIKSSLMSYLKNAAESDRLAVYQAISDRLATVPELDSLSPADQEAWVAAELGRAYSSREAATAQMVDRLDRFRKSLPLLPSTDQVTAHAATQLGVRNLLDSATHQFVTQYGPRFFGATLADIRSGVETGLRQMGHEADMSKLDRRLGTRDNPRTVATWLKMARLVHQMGYITRNGELAEAIKSNPVSTEAGLALFSQRTAFADEMEAALPVLRGEPGAARSLARELVATKLKLDEYYAAGESIRDRSQSVADPDPVRLADHIQSVLEQGGFPARRINAAPGDPTFDLPLNQFHTKIAGEGKWELGFREAKPFSRALTLSAYLDQELSATEFAAYEPAKVSIVDVVPDGYIELKPGQKFTRTNWYDLSPIQTHDGRFFVRDDGTLGTGVPAAAEPVARATNDPANPQPFDPYVGTATAAAFDELPTGQQILTRDVSRAGGTFATAPAEYSLVDTGEVRRGRNAGAEWPVLRHELTGDRYLFKAGRGEGELRDLGPARRLAGPTASKLFSYFGLHTADEIPFSWQGTKGTLQKLLDVQDEIDLAHPERYTREVQAELVKHQVVDWLTGQHDSNSDSFLVADDGFVYGIDKGQAYKYFAEPAPSSAGSSFWDFRTRDALDTHLGEYLAAAVQSGRIELTWNDVEPLLRQIEALPEDVYLAALQPLAKARVADGRFETNAQDFYDAAIARKRSMRSAVKNAYQDFNVATLPGPDALPFWVPGRTGLVDLGTGNVAHLNDRPIPLEELYARNDAQPVPEPDPPPTSERYKAGVVIREPDGRLWVVSPKDGFGGYTYTWPKGTVEAGESFQHAAIREAYEEAGISVVLEGHLADLPNDAGNVTRYYVGNRVSGGPEHIVTANEVEGIALMREAEAGGLLFRNGAPDPRDNAVIDALAAYRASEAQARTTLGDTQAGPLGPSEAVTVADPASEMGYVSHVRLRNGAIVPTAWLDPQIVDPSAINLGNRGIAGRAFDAAFQGWRAWRIAETQKLGLHHALTRDYQITAGQVEQFHSELLRLSRKYLGVSMQGLAGVGEHFPVLNAMREDVAAAAKQVFGEGPFLNRRTGRADMIDFNHQTVLAYRQSLRLNLLAGVTSYLKAIPGLGSYAIIPTADVLYPILRYTLGFIFKPSELVESGMLNAMRGTQLSGDPFIDGLYYRAGFGTGTGILAEERGYDLQLQGMTAFSVLGGDTAAGPPAGQRAKFGQDPFFYERLDPRTLAKKIATEVAPREQLGAGATPPTSSLADSLAGGGLELPDPVRYPDTYPTMARHLLEQTGVDENGNAILQVSGGDKTVRQVQAYREKLLGEIFQSVLADPDAAARYGSGFAVLRNLPPGTVERLAESFPIMHTPVIRQGPTLARQISYAKDAIEAGNPLFPGNLSTGKYQLALYESVTGHTVPVAEKSSFGVSSTTISGAEQWVGFADAKYGGSNAYAEGGQAPGMLVMLKPEALQQSITLDSDRINYGNQVQSIRDGMMTPAAVNAIQRLVAQRMIVDWAAGHSELTFGEFLNQNSYTYLGAIEPFEFAFMNGIKASDIGGLLVPADGLDKWAGLVGDHPDAAGLADVPVVPYDPAVGHVPSMWSNALERAGLLDLAKSRPEDFGAAGGDEGLLALPLTAFNNLLDNSRLGGSYLADRVVNVAADAGLQGNLVYSHADRVSLALNEERINLRNREGSLEAAAKLPKHETNYNYQSAKPDVTRVEISTAQARIASLEALARDIGEFNRTGVYTSHEEAFRATASPDATVAARARNWLDAEGALVARMQSLGIVAGDGPVAGAVRVVDKRTGEVLLDRPTRLDPLEMAGSKYGQAQRANFPWEADRARALLAVHQARAPLGYGAEAEGYLSAGTTRAIAEALNAPAFRAALRARASAKLGIDLPDPVIKGYVRGPAHRLAPSMPTDAGVDSLIITVQDGSGAPYGNLTMPELADLWNQYGLPKSFDERAAAAGYDPTVAGQLSDPNGNDAGVLLHGRGPTPEGRAYVYLPNRGDVKTINGTFEPGPLGKNYVDHKAPAAFDVSFAHHFEAAGQSYVDLETGTVLWKSSVHVEERPGGISAISRVDRRGNTDWTVHVRPATDGIPTAEVTQVDRWGQKVSEVQLRMQAFRDLAGRGDKYATTGLRLNLTSGDDRLAFDRLALKGEIPDWLVAVDNMGAVVDKPAIARELNPGAAAVPMEPPPASFTQLTPEGRFSERLQAELELKGKRGRALAKALFVDPIPFKQRSMDKLGFKLMRDSFAPLMKVEAPGPAAVFSDLKVPEGRWLDFLLTDRALLDRWLKSGARNDWETLIDHAGTYTGKADYATTRQSLDELYTSPGFDTVLETLRMGMKAAQDEAYQVHFFTPYRSTFERSINHPLLGIYPASWAYKAAKEWLRFLYQNQTMGFRAGMVPAQVIRQITDAQAIAVAQNSPQTLDQWLGAKGPYSNALFIFNLLLPGDWGSLPFPASRTIRDVARGNTDLTTIFANNISSIGLGRDLRLGQGAFNELMATITGNAGQGPAFKKAGVSNSPGWSLSGDNQLPTPAPVTPPDQVFTYR